MVEQRFLPARVGILVALTFFISNPEIAIAQTVPNQESASAKPVTAKAAIPLDLGSPDKQLSVASLLQQSGTDTVSIIQGGSAVPIHHADAVTAGQYAAVLQTITGGAQNLILDAAGVAVGGNFTLDQHLGGTLGSLVIPSQVLVRHDFGASSALNIAGNFTNAGTFLGSSSISGATAVLNAANITNLQTGLIATGGTTLNLVLNTPGILSNFGTISSSGNLTLVAGSIVNGPGSTIQAQGNIAAIASASSFFNAGLIQSLTGNVTFAQSVLAAVDTGTASLLNNVNSQLSHELLLNNQGGDIRAKSITILASDLTEIVNVRGGNLVSDVLEIKAPSATININTGNLTGELHLSGREAHVSAATPVLNIGNVCLSGDPTFYNTAGNIVINGSLAFSGAPLALVAFGDILAGAGAGPIDTSSSIVNGGDILLVAGAKFTSDGPVSVLPPAAGDTTSTLSITGASSTGGKIDFSTGDPVSFINSGSTTANGNGGAIRAIAFAGTGGPGPAGAGGTINLGTTLSINSAGNGTGKNGDVLIIAGAASGRSIILGDALTTSNGATGGGGNIQLRTATPTITGGGACSPCVEVKNGAIISGTFGAGALQSGASIGASSILTINGPTAANGTIVIDNIDQLRPFSPGSAVNIQGGGDISTGFIRTFGGSGFSFGGLGFAGLDGGNVSITSNFGNITVNGDINTSGGGGGGANIGFGTAGAGGNAGNVTFTSNAIVTVNGPILAAGGGGGTRVAAALSSGGGGSLGSGGLGGFSGGGLTSGTLGQGGGVSQSGIANHVGLPGDAMAGKAGDVTIVAPDGISVTANAGGSYGLQGNSVFSQFSQTSIYGHNVSLGALQPVTVNGEIVLQGTQTGVAADGNAALNINAPSATTGAIAYVGAANGMLSRSLDVNLAGSLQSGNVGVKTGFVFGNSPLNIFANSNTGSLSVGDIATASGGRVFLGADKGSVTTGNINTSACATCFGINGGGIGIKAQSINTGYIFSYGGGGQKGQRGGNGGDVALLSTNGGISVGSYGINTAGGGGGGRDTSVGPPYLLPQYGGDGGDVLIAAAGNVSLAGPIIALGGGGGDFDSGGGSFGNGGRGIPDGGGLNFGTVGTNAARPISNIGGSRLSGGAGDILIGAAGLSFGNNVGPAYGLTGNAISSPFSTAVLGGHNVTLAANGIITLPGDIFVQGKPDVDPTAVEYAVMLSLIIVVCITAVATLGKGGSGDYIPPVLGGIPNNTTVSNLLFSATAPITLQNINFLGGAINRNDLVISANTTNFAFGNVNVLPGYAVGLGTLNVNVGNTGDITTGNISVPGVSSFISVTSNNGNIATGNLTAHGGALILNSLSNTGTVAAGNLDTTGLSSFSNSGGFVYLNGVNGITTGSINTYGWQSSAQVSNGGNGGSVYITAPNGAITINGAVNTSGGGSDGGSLLSGVGGNGGTIVISAKNALTINGPVLSPGGGRGFFTGAGGNGGGSLGIGGGPNGGGLNRVVLGVGGQGIGTKGTNAGGSDGGSSGAQQVLTGSSVTITKTVGQFYGVQAQANTSPYANFTQFTGFIQPGKPAVIAPVAPPVIPAPPPIPPAPAILVQTITNSTIIATDTLDRQLEFPDSIKSVKKRKTASAGSISSNHAEEIRLIVIEDVNGNVSAKIEQPELEEEDVFRPVAHAEAATAGAPNAVSWTNDGQGLYVIAGSNALRSGNTIQLKNGEIMTDGKSALTVITEFGRINLRSGSIVIMTAAEGHIRVMDVTDSNRGDVTFQAGPRSIRLHPGAEICISTKGEDTARRKLLSDGLARRGVQHYKGDRDLVMLLSDCSLIDALSRHSLLKQFPNGGGSKQVIAGKILKTAAALMRVTASRGAYSAQP